MRLWAPAIVFFACDCAQAQTRGELRFGDGTVLPGTLTDSSAQGGVFHSDRFGNVTFSDAEARFIPAEAEALSQPPTPKQDPQAQMSWQPDTWSIGLSGYWQNDNGTQESNFNLDLAATWTAPSDELHLKFNTNYKVVDDAVDNNEQSGLVRWVHELNSPWVGLGTFRAQRQTFTIDPLREFDYLLLQGTLGVGLRKSWSNGNHALVALGHDWISVNLLNLDRSFHTSATSMLLESRIKLSTRVSLDQTLYLYLWQDGDTGVDSLAELN
jgi:hypothetical protein